MNGHFGSLGYHLTTTKGPSVVSESCNESNPVELLFLALGSHILHSTRLMNYLTLDIFMQQYSQHWYFHSPLCQKQSILPPCFAGGKYLLIWSYSGRFLHRCPSIYLSILSKRTLLSHRFHHSLQCYGFVVIRMNTWI